MKKRYILLVILVILAQTFSLDLLYVDASTPMSADSSSSICAGPSETMSLYFDFQNEMKSVLLGSKINERRFKVSMGDGGLFSQQVLELNNTALDLLLSSVWNRTRSLVSNAGTTAVIVLLASASTLKGNLDGFAILFKDRPVVRDYKRMQDIESELFDVAYFRSKQINLTRSVDGDMVDQINEVVKKYQNLGLFDKNTSGVGSNVSMFDVLWDLFWMNATMKGFIVSPGLGAKDLQSYRGCMQGLNDGENCSAVIRFTGEAVAKLKSDYQGIFAKCNYNYKSLISKATKDSWKSGWQDVEEAIKRLGDVLVGWSIRKDRGCDISDYEMAQIRSYWGDGWTCDDLINLQKTLPYIGNDVGKKKSKQAERKQESNNELLQQTENNNVCSLGGKTSWQKVDKIEDTDKQKQERLKIYGSGSNFIGVGYSTGMNDDFLQIYCLTKTEYDQSEWNSQASDLSDELTKIRGLIDQVDEVKNVSKLLEKELKKISNYQCTG